MIRGKLRGGRVRVVSHEAFARWPLLRAGLSVGAVIAHGAGDLGWAEQAALEMRDLETRYNQPQRPDLAAGPGNQP